MEMETRGQDPPIKQGGRKTRLETTQFSPDKLVFLSSSLPIEIGNRLTTQLAEANEKRKGPSTSPTSEGYQEAKTASTFPGTCSSPSSQGVLLN